MRFYAPPISKSRGVLLMQRMTRRLTYICTLLTLATLLAPLVGRTPGVKAQALPANCTQAGTTVTCVFSYTGAAQTFTVPAGIMQATFDVYGAQGGGGLGGRSTAALAVTPGQTFQVIVGGQGSGS